MVNIQSPSESESEYLVSQYKFTREFQSLTGGVQCDKQNKQQTDKHDKKG